MPLPHFFYFLRTRTFITLLGPKLSDIFEASRPNTGAVEPKLKSDKYKKMGKESRISDKLKLLITVFLLHLCYAGSHLVSRAALNMGISKLSLLIYRNLIAVVFLAPFAYFLEKKDRPPFSFSIFIKLFLLALCGITANQGSYILGLYYLSPTYVSAIQNSTPAITIATAAAFRVEKLNIKKRYGIAKVMGTVVCVGGATILTLFKGPPLFQGQSGLTGMGEAMTNYYSSQIRNWTLGCVFALLNCLAWACWMVFQVPVLKHYPARLSVTALTCFFGVIQYILIAAFSEWEIERWKIHSRGELLALLYTGLVGSGITFSLQTWCIDKAGPLFVAIFQPVQTVLVAILAAIFLGDQLYSGGLIGFIIIIVGLYAVLWGKNEENKAGRLDKEDLTDRLLEPE